MNKKKATILAGQGLLQTILYAQAGDFTQALASLRKVAVNKTGLRFVADGVGRATSRLRAETEENFTENVTVEENIPVNDVEATDDMDLLEGEGDDVYDDFMREDVMEGEDDLLDEELTPANNISAKRARLRAAARRKAARMRAEEELGMDDGEFEDPINAPADAEDEDFADPTDVANNAPANNSANALAAIIRGKTKTGRTKEVRVPITASIAAALKPASRPRRRR